MFEALRSFRPSFIGKRITAVSIPVGTAPEPSRYEFSLLNNVTSCKASKFSRKDPLIRDMCASLVKIYVRY